MSLVFSPWRKFLAFVDYGVTQAYLRRIGAEAVREFKDGVASPKSGRVYMRRGRAHRASAPGEYPARDSGRHVATIASRVSSDSVTVGSGMFYAKFLREGTTKMAPRKMSQNALRSALARDRVGIGRFARFKHV